MYTYLVIVISVVFACISVPLIISLPSRLKVTPVILTVTLTSLVTSWAAISVLMGSEFSCSIKGGSLIGNILLEIDPLSAWFILIINFTLFNGAIYGAGYMKAYESHKNDLSLHWIMYVIFHVSMVWVCMLRNGFAFIIAWEIMTLSSLVLILFDHSKSQTLKAGINYMVQMHIGAALLIIAFIIVFTNQQTTNFAGISEFLDHHSAYWVILLFFLGFGIKAGFIPLHIWLPYAHPAAPSHVSGVMSGVIVKMGIYGILRVAISITQDATTYGIILVMISSATALYGILNASVHRDLKKMLAFCTTENIGIVGMGIGMALIGKGIDKPMVTFLGFSAALMHTLNHSLYKSLLFFTAGNVYIKTHTRNMELLGGLIRYMPHTTIIFLIGSLAIGGFPPLNGFISKFLIYSGFIETFKHQNIALNALMVISIAILSMAGGVSMLTFAKAFGTIFLGEPRTELHHKPVEAGLYMRLPLYLILLLMFTIGLFPRLFLTPLVTVIQHLGADINVGFLAGQANILVWTGRASLILLSLILALLLIRHRALKGRPAEVTGTWGCGYVAPRPSMQYTGKSFSKSLAKLFGFITIEDKKYDELQSVSIFPAPRSYASIYLEFFETRIFDPAIKQFLRIFNLFTFIHNGKIQLYVLYGLIFMVVLIILSVINVI